MPEIYLFSFITICVSVPLCHLYLSTFSSLYYISYVLTNFPKFFPASLTLFSVCHIMISWISSLLDLSSLTLVNSPALSLTHVFSTLASIYVLPITPPPHMHLATFPYIESLHPTHTVLHTHTLSSSMLVNSGFCFPSCHHHSLNRLSDNRLHLIVGLYVYYQLLKYKFFLLK